MLRKYSLPLLVLIACFAGRPDAFGADKSVAGKDEAAKEAAGKFLRVLRDADGEPIAMETSISRYVPKGADRPGVVVELVSAIHIGDRRPEGVVIEIHHPVGEIGKLDGSA